MDSKANAESSSWVNIPLKEVHQCGRWCGVMSGIFERAVGETIGQPFIIDFSSLESKNRCELTGTECEASFRIESDAMPLYPEEVVIRDTEIKISFSYPLKSHAEFKFSNPSGFTRGELVNIVRSSYRRIYEEEEKTIREKPVVPIDQRRGLINRNQTDGKYEIWGHDIDDLFLEGLQYNQRTQTVILAMGS